MAPPPGQRTPPTKPSDLRTCAAVSCLACSLSFVISSADSNIARRIISASIERRSPSSSSWFSETRLLARSSSDSGGMSPRPAGPLTRRSSGGGSPTAIPCACMFPPFPHSMRHIVKKGFRSECGTTVGMTTRIMSSPRKTICIVTKSGASRTNSKRILECASCTEFTASHAKSAEAFRRCTSYNALYL